MIKSFSELLEELKSNGIDEIEPYLSVKHGPMIGGMYEGLTKELIDRVIFDGLDLSVVSGKITNSLGSMSKQIDCIIVCGKGNKLPFTDEYLYDISNVVAVIEVKKNFYTKELDSSYHNMVSVSNSFEANHDLELSQVVDAYRSIYGEELPEHNNLKSVTFQRQMVYHTLVMESYLPLRIVFGYSGFKTEYSLREGFVNYLESNTGNKGFGALNFPSLIICNELSLLKLNGMPYAMKHNVNDAWALYGSYARNSMTILLEILWTRLTYKFGLGSNIFGDEFKIESINPLLIGKCIQNEDITGWVYDYYNLSEAKLSSFLPVEDWEPAIVSQITFVIFQIMCNEEFVNFNNEKLIELITSYGQKVEDVKLEVLETNLVYKCDNGDVGLITKQCACVIGPKGYYVGENVDGRLMRYITRNK